MLINTEECWEDAYRMLRKYWEDPEYILLCTTILEDAKKYCESILAWSLICNITWIREFYKLYFVMFSLTSVPTEEETWLSAVCGV